MNNPELKWAEESDVAYAFYSVLGLALEVYLTEAVRDASGVKLGIPLMCEKGGATHHKKAYGRYAPNRRGHIKQKKSKHRFKYTAWLTSSSSNVIIPCR